MCDGPGLTVGTDIQISRSHITPLSLPSRQITPNEYRLTSDRVDRVILDTHQALGSESCSVDYQVDRKPSPAVRGESELFDEILWELQVVCFVQCGYATFEERDARAFERLGEMGNVVGCVEDE